MHTIADGLVWLACDHRQLERLQQRCLRVDLDAAARRDAVQSLCGRLAVHSVLEMQLLWPLLREAGVDAEPIDEAIIEQVLVEELIASLATTAPSHPEFGIRLQRMAQLIHDHVRAQERELFVCARALRIDVAELGRQLRQMQAQARTHVMRHLASARARQAWSEAHHDDPAAPA